MSRIRSDLRKPPQPSEKPKRQISRQRRKTMDRTAEYNAMRDIYLEENPKCAACGGIAVEIHHVVSGTAGRPRSLLNQNAWLGLCRPCHEHVGGSGWKIQAALKAIDVLETIERLRK